MKRIWDYYKKHKLDIAAIITLIAILIKLLGNLPDYLDVLFLDDSFYMMAGVKFFDLPYKAFGQLYRFRFWLMHLWEQDLVGLYYLNYKLSLILSPLLLYFFLRRVRLSVIFALIIAVFFSISAVHVTTWPRVSHMCIEMILLALILSTYIKSTYNQLFLFVITAFFMSFVRNEFFVSYLMLLFLFIGWGMVQIVKGKRISLFLYFLVIGALYFVVTKKLGNPMMGDGAGRAIVAFGQHFAYNYVTWNNLTEPFWVTWMDIMQHVFGDLVDFKTAFKENQELLIKHVFSNVKNFFLIQSNNIGDVILPNALVKIHPAIKIIGAALVFIILRFKFKNTQAIQDLKTNNVLFFGFVITIILLPTFAASILIYPRDHYLVMQMLLVVMFLVILIKQIDIKLQLPPVVILSFMVVLFLLSPKADKYAYFNLLRKNEGTPNKMAIKKLNEIYKQQDTLVVFEHEGGLINFIKGDDSKKKWLSRLGMDTAFVPYILKEKVNVIYYTDFLSLDPKIKNDSTWQKLIQNPSSLDFIKVELENSPKDRYLLIKKGFR